MHEHVTLLRPDARAFDDRGISSALPRDLLEQVRKRVGAFALLILLGFSLDLLVYFGGLIWLLVSDHAVPPGLSREGRILQLLTIAGFLASAALWWVARNRRISPSRLHTLALGYEVVIGFVMAIGSYWQYYIDEHVIPPLTWVPSMIILFPILIPGPPRRMLAGAVATALMSPLALLLLDRSGTVPVGLDGYFQAMFSGAVAVAFAYVAARVVYGLGRQVAAAREMGSYRLEERLGQGGMGEVWRARHRLLARPAAIKLIRRLPGNDQSGPESEDAIRRFGREAQAIAQLRSPHTVELFDFGVADDGAFYYVMELLDGLDTDALVRRFGPLPPERAVHLLRQVCHSLSEAESRGLVHRDIKPANIFLCRYGEDYDFVKVLDFGIVKGPRQETDPALTGATAVQGTPAFIAPEQALGGTVLDGRADIYATGCVAYWLLTGQLVFTAETPLGLMMHHASTAPSAPSARTDQPIPRALDELVLSCLSKDPAERPQTARELGGRLAGATGGAEWTQDRARGWWRSHDLSQRG